MTTIYMPLLNEGVDVWRPVNATHVGSDQYRIDDETPSEEEWAFAPGSIVRCEMKTLSGGERLTAVEAC